ASLSGEVTPGGGSPAHGRRATRQPSTIDSVGSTRVSNVSFAGNPPPGGIGTVVGNGTTATTFQILACPMSGPKIQRGYLRTAPAVESPIPARMATVPRILAHRLP